MLVKVNNIQIIIDDEDLILLKDLKLRPLVRHDGTTSYIRCRRFGKEPTILLHRIIMNAKPGEIIDHINGNGLDNRKSNLRICSIQINNGNARIRKDNTTGVKGCHWNNKTNKFTVRIQIENIRYTLGHFIDIEDAKYCYEEAYYNHCGRFSR